MNQQQLKNIVEAALLAADQPLNIDRLLGLFVDEAPPSKEDLRAALDALGEDYTDRGIELKEVSSGYRFQVRQEVAPWVTRLWEEKPARYTRALLETLALIAYKQPITRGEIEDVRGVAVSSNIIKTLLERDWIRVLGHRDVPGRPALYGTTRYFLDYFNLKSLEELPTLLEVRDLEEIEKMLGGGEAIDIAAHATTAEPVPDTAQGDANAPDIPAALEAQAKDVPSIVSDEVVSIGEESLEINKLKTNPQKEGEAEASLVIGSEAGSSTDEPDAQRPPRISPRREAKERSKGEEGENAQTQAPTHAGEVPEPISANG